MIQGFTEERAWFATDREMVLGAVVFDRKNKDWAYVILERAEDSKFRLVAGRVSLKSQEHATAELKTALEKRARPR